MNLKAHYDLPDNCLVDVVINKASTCRGHKISIIAKYKESLYKTILPEHYFWHLEHPVVKINSFEAPDVKVNETLIEIFEEGDEESTVCFDFQTGSGYATLDIPNLTSEFLFDYI